MLSTCNRVELYVAVDDADRAAAGLAEVLARRGGRRGRRSGRAPLPAPGRGGGPPPVPGRVQPRFAGGGRAADPRPDQAGVRGRRPARHRGRGAARPASRRARSASRGACAARRRSPATRCRSARSRWTSRARSSATSRAERVLIVGAGKMSELAARTLRTHGATLTVINRTRARADELAQRFGADVADWSDLRGALHRGRHRHRVDRRAAAGADAGPDQGRCARRAAAGRCVCSTSASRATSIRRRASWPTSTCSTSTPCRSRRATTAPSARRRRPRPRRSSRRSWGGSSKRWRSRQLGPMVSALQAHFQAIARAEVAARLGRRRRAKRRRRGSI